MTPPPRIDVVLIAAGKYHDIDFARLELLKLLAEDERVRVRVFEDYANLRRDPPSATSSSPTPATSCPASSSRRRCARGSKRGGRWSRCTARTRSCVSSATAASIAARMGAASYADAGHEFIAHPPIAPYRVEVADPAASAGARHRAVRDHRRAVPGRRTPGKLTCCSTPSSKARPTGFVRGPLAARAAPGDVPARARPGRACCT